LTQKIYTGVKYHQYVRRLIMIKILSGCIASTDNLLTIHTEQAQDSTIFGRVTLLPSKIEVVTQFTKRSSTIYVSRLRIDADLLQDVEAATINIELVSSTFSKKFPQQDLPVDKEKIKQSTTVAKHKEVQELKLKVMALDETLRGLTEGRALTKIALKNTDSIAPGMVPVAIDNQGNFIAAYPFNDMIKDVNGITPVSSSLKLTADDIPMEAGISIQEAWSSYIQTTTKILGYLSEIENQLSQVNKKLETLELNLTTHLNTGVI
jgi:hypothetical protein